jgi:hypothetical protein
LNLLKAFQNRRDCHRPAFKSGEHCAAHFSKEDCSSATYLPDLKTGEIAPRQFSKALSATTIRRSSNKSIRFELASFENLSANSKGFGAKQLRTY